MVPLTSNNFSLRTPLVSATLYLPQEVNQKVSNGTQGLDKTIAQVGLRCGARVQPFCEVAVFNKV
jgi:hypothetical protein